MELQLSWRALKAKKRGQSLIQASHRERTFVCHEIRGRQSTPRNRGKTMQPKKHGQSSSSAAIQCCPSLGSARLMQALIRVSAPSHRTGFKTNLCINDCPLMTDEADPIAHHFDYRINCKRPTLKSLKAQFKQRTCPNRVDEAGGVVCGPQSAPSLERKAVIVGDCIRLKVLGPSTRLKAQINQWPPSNSNTCEMAINRSAERSILLLLICARIGND